jgi:multiple sugar transport system permease protein
VKGNFESTGGKIAFYFFITLFVLMTLFPLLWIIKMSVISQSELSQSPPTIFPQTLDFSAYGRVFDEPRFIKGLLNTIVIAGITTVVCLAAGSVAAYAIARLKFRLQSAVLGMILAIAFFPAVAILGPLFLIFDGIGITDTYQAMIIPDILFALPLTVYLLVAYFRELPLDIEEAAKVDGAGPVQAFTHVTLPLSIPGVATTGILTFIFAATEYLFANTFSFTTDSQPATVIIPQFATQYVTDYGAQAAASMVLTIPLTLLVLVFQKKIVTGLTAGAVK